MVLNDLITSGSKSFPEKPALVYGKERCAYQKLELEIRQLSAGLLDLDIKFGDRIALFLNNRPEFLVIYFAILRLGAIPVPLNYLWKEEELGFVVSDSGAKIIFTETNLLRTGLNLRNRVPALEKIILVDHTPDLPESVIAYRNLFCPEPKQPLPITAGSDVAVIIYTSGTTGFPKGVMLTHDNLLANVESCRKAISLSSNDRFLCILPLFHSFAFTTCVLLPLALGSTIFLVSKRTPFRNLITEIIRKRITVFIGIPDFYQIFGEIRIPFATRIMLRLLNPIRLAISGAAPLSPKTLAAFEDRFRIPLLEGYGLTEAAPVVTLNPPKKRRAGSIGIPLPGVELKIVSESGEELLVGQTGELAVRGKNVMAGYFNRLEDTREVIRDGWLLTGDLGKKDEKGYFYIVDRKKEMIDFRGMNIYPREVEAVICRHPDVKEAAVIGELTPTGEIPVAFIILKEGRETKSKEILDFSRRYLATYKLPRRIIFKAELPRTATGKIAKRELRGMS
ncbi:MAG: long-chain-fatty-acid--CoA ligase [Candidatus Omnitrophica bacterium]|nr:long-chain-fatty-acid--CoA ligase [Candidatus Omnitrophota bacterium]